MITRIDWLSFSLMTDDFTTYHWQDWPHFLAQVIIRHMGTHASLLRFDDVWEVGKGRAPYSHSMRRQDGGVVIFFHPTLPHILVEVTGRACEEMHHNDTLEIFLESVSDRLTRLDIASDMLCDVNPLAFVSQREEGRFRSHSEFVSESGTTAYVGSRTSDRYARVYRYNPPHERSHMLRCEFVVKGENARRAAAAVLADGVDAVARTFGDAFGWLHEAWQPDAQNAAEITMWRPERREGKTLFWLAQTIAPLILRLHDEGTIDAEQWWRDHILPGLTRKAEQL